MSVVSMSCVILAIAVLSGCLGEKAKPERAQVDAPVVSSHIGGALETVTSKTKDLDLTAFYQSSYWQDGKAEVARYKATRSRYGSLREFPMMWVTVKEEFNPTLLVKSDQPGKAGNLPVMKSHAVFTMPTENYDYHFAGSMFFRRDMPATLVKATTTSHEWCGITTKQLNLKGDSPSFEYRSYFEAEHDGEYDVDWPEFGVFEEQLIGVVRAIPFKEGWSHELSVLERQVTSHMSPLVWRPGTLSVKGRREIKDARERTHDVWHVVFEAKNGDVLSYDVSADDGHVVIAHQAPGGVTLLLDEQVRWAYWDFSKPSPFAKEPHLAD